ncbi:ATP-dependent nuclease [Moellerella wisconsensis]|uniref:Putative OLD family ATP-dependent endonuclease n=1 Tax=Moellerella wisconsensis ATCC 35017 TaxID=1354267 RepID=A0A0N0Z9Z0_9GAMM|nr:ATP-dependent endonuclease [Moellerella wisconsensis]KPD02026.1 putative OLD family ATP-dependent endonuclease [Moellerella wisconsensis ATCC 35017]VFS54234.1 recombination protein F [Moellerella wisconsensis]
MYLERVEIYGFRGINRLSLSLNNNTVLIGENAWGKSSLLDALTILLSPEKQSYQFSLSDFHHPAGDDASRFRNLHIILKFCETRPGRHQSYRFHNLSSVWVDNGDDLKRIFYQVSAELDDDNNISVKRNFLNSGGNKLSLDNPNKYINEIIRLYPVLRLRDARFLPDLKSDVITKGPEIRRENYNEKMQQLTKELVNNPQNLSDDELNEGIDAMQQLLGHYFAEQGSYIFTRELRQVEHIEPKRRGWNALSNINRIIAKPNQRNIRLIILGMFSSMLQSKGNITLDKHARPLIIVEDPETRLHPIMLSIAWGLLNLFSLQRITTTNSGELLSQVPIENLCRLVRDSNKVSAYRLRDNEFTATELRRISFHIRFNRPSALFARTWLLVEGETEIWLMNELAKQCNYYFDTEGIKVIEFAQSGLNPLLKFATKMGIEWHTLVDGDEAGKKYAATVKSFAEKMGDQERDRLTKLSAPDMEHFLYREGFSQVYHDVAGIPDNAKLSIRRVIIKAIQRASKPDLAIAVVNRAAEKGSDSIPVVLKNMFSRVAWLARGKA